MNTTSHTDPGRVAGETVHPSTTVNGATDQKGSRPMARKAPTQRKRTVSDRRTLRVETASLPLVIGVAVIAALISFVALKWVGEYMGMSVEVFGVQIAYAALLPLAIDGFGIICALGIVRSNSVDESFLKRVSEWGGLAISLALSIAGNVVHTLHFVDGTLPPRWLIVAYSAAIPAIVAYGLHLLGRTLRDSLSARIYVDDPDHVQLDVPGVTQAPAEQPRTRATQPKTAPARQAPAARPVPQPARAVTEVYDDEATRPVNVRAIAGRNSQHEEVFSEYRDRRAQGDRMQGGEIAEKLGLHPGRARTLRSEWDKRIDAEQATADMPRPELDLETGKQPEKAEAVG